MVGILAILAVITLATGLWPLTLFCGALMFVVAGSNHDKAIRVDAMASASTKGEQAMEIGNTAAHGCIWTIIAIVVAVAGSMATLSTLGFGG